MNTKNTKELSIHINMNGLSFCVLNTFTNTIEHLKTINFEHKLTPFDTLTRLKTALNNTAELSEDFNKVYVIHQNGLSTLVPKSLYNENNKADYLKFNAKILKTDFITQDNIAQNNSVNVYIPYVNINNYVFDVFGEFTYKHASSVFIQTILKNYNLNEKPKMFINVNAHSFELLVLKNKALQLFNVFDYTTKEDFIYYVLFVFEQLKLDAETTEVLLSGTIDKDDALFSILYTYVRHVTIIETAFNYKNSTNTEVLHHNFLILNSF